MITSEENLRVIFGLKLKQQRLKKGYSTKELADRSDLSASYINEIEKGKKYPKADKIMSLAQALDESYDNLVSLQLGDHLGQLSDLLSSSTFQEMPLEVFGIKKSDLMGLMSDDPTRFSALVSTFVEIARIYDVQVEHFLFATLRRYQELENNYSEEFEQKARDLLEEHGWTDRHTLPYDELATLLEQDWDYTIDETTLPDYPELHSFRSIFLPEAGNRFLINPDLKPIQKSFLLARELAFNILGVKKRPLTSSWIKAESFEQILNNYNASYIAGAMLLQKDQMVDQISGFFDRTTWSSDALLEIMNHFEVTPEMFFHRLTQLLPHEFGLEKLFFLRCNHQMGSDEYTLTKELHLSGLHSPHGVARKEHYCRRWVTISVLEELAQKRIRGEKITPMVDSQISQFHGTENRYFCFSFARPLALNPDTNSSVTIGMMMNRNFKRTVSFWNDPAIRTRIVNETCERCPIPDCAERSADPKVYRKRKMQRSREKTIQQLREDLRRNR